MGEMAGSRAAIFWLQIFYLVVLAALAALFVYRPDLVPAMLGPIPTGVPWFGALGAAMISLWGVTEHRADWDPRWKYWHWSRPFVGAALAAVTVLIFKAGILAVGKTADDTSPGTNQNLLYYVLSFVVGYREEAFRELLKKVGDVILGPGSTAAPPTITALNPATGPIAGGTRVVISGSGFTGVTAVRFGAIEAQYTIKSDTSIEATSPKAEAGGEVPVTVEGHGGAAAVSKFVYT